jgi:hypothetical protein
LFGRETWQLAKPDTTLLGGPRPELILWWIGERSKSTTPANTVSIMRSGRALTGFENGFDVGGLGWLVGSRPSPLIGGAEPASGRSQHPLRVALGRRRISGKPFIRTSGFGRGARVRLRRESGRPTARSGSGAHRPIKLAGVGGLRTRAALGCGRRERDHGCG